MQTLLLCSSSRFLDNDLTSCLGKPLSNLRIIHIITASKGKGVGDLAFLERARDILRKNNCYFEDFDLDGKNEKELLDKFENFDGVFVDGGNSFYLLKSIKESGFDKVIKKLLPKGFIYMGASAGSYVACPTIDMATWKHQDKYDHYGLKNLSAMNLVPFLLTAHYAPEYHEILKVKIPLAKYPTEILSDSQAILVRNDEFEILGGEKINL